MIERRRLSYLDPRPDSNLGKVLVRELGERDRLRRLIEQEGLAF
jgi:hypothetical protein